MTTVTEERIEQIARVIHVAIAELQAQHGDPNPPFPGDTEDADAHAVTAASVRAVLDGATPRQLHETWCQARQGQGWARGPRKDSRLKTHPCLVPYDQLPEYQKVKDRVFVALVWALTTQEEA